MIHPVLTLERVDGGNSVDIGIEAAFGVGEKFKLDLWGHPINVTTVSGTPLTLTATVMPMEV